MLLVEAVRAVDEHLLDHRQRGQGVFAAHSGVDRHVAEAGDGKLLRLEFAGQGVPGGFADGRVLGQEHQRGGVALGQREPGLFRHRAQEGVRLLEQQAAAVARQSVGGDGAAVGHAAQRMDGALHQRMRGLVVHLGDQPEAAGILFEIGAVERAPKTVLSVHSVFKKRQLPKLAKSFAF